MGVQHSGAACHNCRANVMVTRTTPPHLAMFLVMAVCFFITGPMGCVFPAVGWLVGGVVCGLVGLIWILVGVFGGGPWRCTRCGMVVASSDTPAVVAVLLVAPLGGVLLLLALTQIVPGLVSATGPATSPATSPATGPASSQPSPQPTAAAPAAPPPASAAPTASTPPAPTPKAAESRGVSTWGLPEPASPR